MNQKAFSLIELLVSVTIIVTVASIATFIYQKQKNETLLIVAKNEMIELQSLMMTAYKTDGGFHQYIYQASYRPAGKRTANVGIKFSSSRPCCNKYPPPGSSPCSSDLSSTQKSIKIDKGERCPIGTINKNNFSYGKCDNNSGCECETAKNPTTQYLYYTCGNSALELAKDTKSICTNSNYSLKCKWPNDELPDNLLSTDFGSCDLPKTDWCSCDQLSIGATSKAFTKKVVLKKDGTLCVKK